jgi:hypothetical protein
MRRWPRLSPLLVSLSLWLGIASVLATFAGCNSREMDPSECGVIERFLEEVCLECDGAGRCIEMGRNRCVEICGSQNPCSYADFPVCGPGGTCVPASCAPAAPPEPMTED